jgi:hypothetical protein
VHVFKELKFLAFVVIFYNVEKKVDFSGLIAIF